MDAPLKGMHQTIDSWRPNRDEDGWKMKSRDWMEVLAAIVDDDERNRLVDSHLHDHPDRVP